MRSVRHVAFVFIVLLGVLGTNTGGAQIGLVAHWRLDEGAGTTVFDSAGAANGTIIGATWVNDTERGWVLDFGACGYVDIDLSTVNPLATVNEEMTIAFWQYGNNNMSGERGAAFWTDFADGGVIYIYFPIWRDNQDKIYFKRTPDLVMSGGIPAAELEGIWSHWAFVKNATTGEMKIYKDGSLLIAEGGLFEPVGGEQASAIRIGNDTADRWPFRGRMSDFRIYDSEISAGEIKILYNPDLGARASDPSPADQAIVQPDVTLSWTPGVMAASHDVYLGTSFDDVNDATISSPPSVYKGNYDVNCYEPTGLAEATTYYWRVDGVSGTNVWQGDVWTFTTALTPEPGLDPNLVGWWKFDTGSGIVAFDCTTYGNHAVLRGDTGWTSGQGGGALRFDGDGDYVDCGRDASLDVAELTWALWIKRAETTFSDERALLSTEGAESYTMTYTLQIDADGDQQDKIQFTKHDDPNCVWSDTAISDVEWHHVAVTRDAAGQTTIYINGQPDGSGTVAERTVFIKTLIAKGPGVYSTFYGAIDDVRIYNRALGQGEVADLMRFDNRTAWNPEPGHGRTVPLPDATPITWSPGEGAREHDVYFGTDLETVTTADTSSVGVYRGRQDLDANSYTPAEDLQYGQTYCWRVDQVNGTEIRPGLVWNFKVEEYLVVDDMESYGEATTPGEPGSRIWYAWRDGFGWSEPAPGQAGNGTGSMIGNDDAPFVETQIVHSGKQSMPYTYNNTGANGKAFYSEAEHLFDAPQDWTQYDIKALVLYFHGSAGNDANEQMYIKLEDSDSHSKKVFYDGDASDVSEATWHEWNIALQDFSGVDLSKISKMVIGFGDGIAPTGSGTGKVYFDDIRLYPARCVPEYAPLGDISGDCEVDFGDFVMLAEDWLKKDETLVAEAPNPAGLRVWYKFDELSGSTAADSSGRGHHGAISGGAWATGKVDGALNFGGVTHVDMPTDVLATVKNEISVALWQKCADNAWGHRNVVIWQYAYEGTTTEMYIYLPNHDDTIMWKASQPDLIKKAVRQDEVVGDWSHWVFTKNAATGEMKIYQNGLLWHSDAGKTTPIPGADCSHLWLGKRPIVTENTYPFYGMMDEFRIYDYELSEAEVLTLAGVSGLYFPLTSEANLYDEEPQDSKSINFNDLAVLAEDWLETRLWPPR